MSTYTLDFDSTTVAPSAGFSGGLLPDGEYAAKIDRWKVFQNEDGSTTLATSYTITEGPHARRFVKEKFTVAGGDAKRVARDRSRLAKLQVALGMPTEKDVDSLVGDVTIKVGTLKASGTYEAKNVINDVMPSHGGASLPVPAAAPGATKKVPGFMAGKPKLA